MRFSQGATTINNVIPVIIKRKNEYRKTGKPPSREKETVRVGEKKREKEALENGGGRQEGKRTSQSGRKTKSKSEKERTRQGNRGDGEDRARGRYKNREK